MVRFNFGNLLFFVAALLSTAYGHTEHEFNNGTYKLMTHGHPANRSIDFYLTVETLGWIGVGVGPNAAMTDADILVAGVEDGEPYYTDMYALSNGLPTADKKNESDWTLVSAEQDTAAGITKMTFNRLIKTEDPNVGEDYEIKNADLYVLMAYGENHTLSYHRENRLVEKVNIGKEAAGGAAASSAVAALVTLCISLTFGLKF